MMAQPMRVMARKVGLEYLNTFTLLKNIYTSICKYDYIAQIWRIWLNATSINLIFKGTVS